jgi:rare lipoprotein A
MSNSHLPALVGLVVIACLGSGCTTQPATPSPEPTVKAAAQPEAQAPDPAVLELAELPPIVPRQIDHSGRKQQGRASYYADHFDGQKMANGNRFNPNSNVAASKTLPLGTVARVTNLDNGKSALVKVEDRGPYVRGRIVDVTPLVAARLDMQHRGVVPVVVAPIAVPQPNGAVKLGAGAVQANTPEIEAAVQAAAALR